MLARSEGRGGRWSRRTARKITHVSDLVQRYCNPMRSAQDVFKWYRHWGTLPVSSWVRAAECFRQEDFRNAVSHYKVGLRRKSNHPAASSARFDLAYCLYRTGDLAESVSHLEELLTTDQPLKEAFLLKARIELAFGCVVSASRTMHSCLQLFPNDLQVLSCYTHAVVLSRLQGSELETLKQRLYFAKRKLGVEDERNVHLDTALAHFEIRCGDVVRGERLLARVLATGTAPFEAVLLRGERLLEQGRLLPAREQLTRAMMAARRDPRPLMLLAKSYLRIGAEFQPEWAVQLAEVACRLSAWQNAESLGVLVRAYEAGGQQGNAQLFAERLKNLPSTGELNLSYFKSSLQQLRGQKLSNS